MMATKTPLRSWQERMGYEPEKAAKVLGIGRSTYYLWLGRERLSRVAALACAAVEAGIEPIGEISNV